MSCKLSILAGSKPEVEGLINMFIHQVKGTTVVLRWSSGDVETYGDGFIPDFVNGLEKLDAVAKPLRGADKWYAMGREIQHCPDGNGVDVCAGQILGSL